MLQAFLPELVEVLDRHGELAVSKEVKDPLCRMSSATIDRALKTHRQRGLRRPFSTTKPGSLLKAAIPIRTFADWNDKRPRFLEIDLVAPCGVSAEWFYLNILSAADVATGWLECQVELGKGQQRVGAAITRDVQTAALPAIGIGLGQRRRVHQSSPLRLLSAEEIT